MAGWTPKAETLKKAANDILWNANAGLPHDNETVPSASEMAMLGL
jgi:hypothetical protein